MKRILLSIASFSVISYSAFAGGLLTNTNQNVHFLRNPARDASTEIDAVYSNPAGLVFLKENGFHLSLNVQSAFQTRIIESTFAPFAGYGGSPTKKYEGEASAPFVPSLQAAYKKDKWAFSASFAVTGGGGKATFNKGLGSFESLASTLPEYVNKIGAMIGTIMPGATLSANQYSVDSYMEGSQIIYGFQLGATYKITDNLSAFGGLRMNYVNNGYVGYLRNVKINPTSNIPVLNRGNELVSANDYFTQLAESGMIPEDYKGKLEELVSATTDKELECDQTGWGVTPIIGVDFNWNNLNVGVKYEFNTHLNIENKTKINTTGISDFDDGVNTPHDIPALLTIGVSYKIIPSLTASVGYHHFFDKQAKMANDKQKALKSGTNEYLFGLEWDALKWLQVSGGVQRAVYGLGDGYMSDLSFITSAWSFGVGAGLKLTEKLNVNIAYFWSSYDDYTKETTNYNQTGLTYTEVFTRTNKVFGVGVDYRF